MLLPPNDLRATMDVGVFDMHHAPDVGLTHPCPSNRGHNQSRRAFLRAAAGFTAAGLATPAFAGGPLVFNTESQLEPANHEAASKEAPEAPVADTQLVMPRAPRQEALRQLALGEIPADFWERPRELHLQRQGAKERFRIVYWRDGKLVPDGYWAACRVLRDVKANMMTYMDPAMLDILRGIIGYYEAWRWNYPIVITSGYRTEQTNKGLRSEGAAKNSMHLYGRAVDLYMQGIQVTHLAQLGVYFQRGGVGFYPQRGFVHLDTGRLRVWKG